MWPEALTELMEQTNELLLQIARLVPMTDSLVASKEASDTALTKIAEGLPRGFRQMSAANAGMEERLHGVEELVKTASTDAKQARAMGEVALSHAAEIEQQVRKLSLWIKVGVTALVVLLLITIVLLLGQR